MKTKEEVIQEAYGGYFNKNIDNNGWCNNHSLRVRISDIEIDRSRFGWRPKSLQGIEDNNGWIKIESEADLPEFGYYEVIRRNDGYQTRASLNNEFSKKHQVVFYSHYQPIIQIPNPIY